MDAVLKVNQHFWDPQDWRKLAGLAALLVVKGKAAEFLSETARRRLSSVSGTAAEFSKAIILFAAANLLLSPVDVVFNEAASRLRQYWSHKLTMAMANKMMRRKLRDEDDDKSFETLVASEADRFVEIQIDLGVEALQALTHLFFFTRILWRLSPTLGSAALASSVFGTSVSLLLGRHALARMFREERKANGDFSHNLSRCRENMESIQFGKGEDFELERIERLDVARQVATSDRKRAKDLLSLFSLLLRRMAGGVLPSVILRREHDERGSGSSSGGHGNSHEQNHGHSHEHGGHSHSHGHLSRNATHASPHHSPKASSSSAAVSELISELAQATEAFDEILYHLLIVSENFHSVSRLITLGSDICEVLERSAHRDIRSHIKTIADISKDEETASKWLEVSNLTVAVPKTGVTLLEDLSVSLRYGDSLLLTGASGCGKTALLRVLFGLWPAQQGSVSRPEDDRIIVLPQKPFCCTGTLAEQVTYPKASSAFNDEAVKSALVRVGLKHILDRHELHRVEKWQEELSMGEQQRLGFARIVLHEPEFALLDESSSSLDLESEAKMYDLVTEVVKGGFVSIGHRKSIERYHLHRITMLGPLHGGKWKQDF